MALLREIIAEQEARLWISRDAELAHFREWVAGSSAEFLNVYGPPGIGKTAFLRACAREAAVLGHPVRSFGIGSTREDMGALIGLARHELADVTQTQTASPVLMFDNLDRLSAVEAEPLFREFFPQLDSSVRVALASRGSLMAVWTPYAPWTQLVCPLRLRGLSRAQVDAYLRQCGLDDEYLARTIFEAAGGHPMALSMVSNIALRAPSWEFAKSPEWRLIIRGLLDYCLADVDRSVSEAILRGELRANAGREDGRGRTGDSEPAWDTHVVDQLCRLSLIRIIGQGFAFEKEFEQLLRTYCAQPERGGGRSPAPARRPYVLQSRSSTPRARGRPADTSASPGSPNSARYQPLVARALAGLTPREKEIADHVARGQTTNRQLAEALVITPGTANLHVKRILAKLGFTNRAQLAGWLAQRISSP